VVRILLITVSGSVWINSFFRGDIHMNKQVAKKLRQEAMKVGLLYSNKNREHNHNNETFIVETIKPMSEYTAAVNYRKKPTDKLALAFFYYINTGDGYWNYFFPSDSHIIGFETFGSLKQKVEDQNFEKNFVVVEEE